MVNFGYEIRKMFEELWSLFKEELHTNGKPYGLGTVFLQTHFLDQINSMFKDPFIQDILFSVNRPGPEVIRLFHAQFTYSHEFVVIMNFWLFKIFFHNK